jgi:MoxR-like ATPase
LEAMQERRVTIAGQVRPLPSPFLVVATQNPIEQEGTYPLPEAQLDRFMFALDLVYPTREEEIEIVTRTTIGENSEPLPVIEANDILNIQKIVRAMPVSRYVVEHAVDLVTATRSQSGGKVAQMYLEWGAGPRASQYLILGAKAYALMDGRAAPETRDVVKVAPMVLAHRIVPNFRATGEGLSARTLVQQILTEVRQPSLMSRRV